MSSIIGKQFENKGNSEVIKVVSIEGNIAVLENEQRISVERLLDRNYYVEHSMMVNESVNNTSNSNDILFGENNLHNQLFTQIQGLSNDDVNRAGNHGGVQLEHSPVYVNPVENHRDAQSRLNGDNVYNGSDSQHQEMLEKARRDQLDLESKMRRQASKVGKLIDGIEEEVNIPVNRNLEGTYIEDSARETRETSISVIEPDGDISSVTKKPIIEKPVVNPMFTKMKRTNKVSLKIDIDEMVPSKDLLKMLEEGFEDSVLEYLTQEIANKVLSDVNIKSQIHKKLHEYVYGKPRVTRKPTPVKKVTTAKKTTPKK